MERSIYAQNSVGNSVKKKLRGNADKIKPYQFKAGQSGNPGGRPKLAPISQACRELLNRPVPGDTAGRTYAEAIAQTLAEKALAGDIRAVQEIADRAEGRARQAIEFEDQTIPRAFERMTSKELEAYIRDGTIPSWFPQTQSQATNSDLLGKS
jgi:Family of unknown function (DUF5681)